MNAASQGPTRADFASLLVALFLLLMCFFITLLSISERDSERLQSAVDSINRTFKLNDRLVTVADKKAEPRSYQVFLGDLQSWIGQLYALGNVSIARRGNQIAVTIRHPDFFLPGSTQFSPDAAKALKALADLISTWQSDYLMEMEVIADAPVERLSPSMKLDPRVIPRSAGHAGIVASYLIRSGIAPQMIYASMRDGSDPTLAFTFILRVPPKLDTTP